MVCDVTLTGEFWWFMRDKFICRFQDSSNQSIVCALFVLRVLTLPPCQGSACWFNICQIFVDNQQNSRAGFQALMSYHACLSNDMSAWARRWHLPTQPTPAQTTRDLVQLLREICEVVGGSILEPVLWSSGRDQQSDPSADWPRNTGWSLVVLKQHCLENAVISYFGDARLVN